MKADPSSPEWSLFIEKTLKNSTPTIIQGMIYQLTVDKQLKNEADLKVKTLYSYNLHPKYIQTEKQMIIRSMLQI
ncbi:unnamed protein product [Lactuca virosa]|uniref:Cysteine proteinase inhibitor n=1 Tax=Lactuca virosa TaxID=75947 RepID=A0AAU9MQT2_9ASTR|nr:unnamed protein product [Lactuca virosa]